MLSYKESCSSKTACSPSNCHDTIPAALRHTNNFYSADDTDNALENVMDVDSDDDTNIRPDVDVKSLLCASSNEVANEFV